MISTNITEIALFLSFINVVAVGIATWLLHRQIKTNHEWNRRRTSHELIFDFNNGTPGRLRSRLESKINIYDKDQTYRTVQDKMTPKDKMNLEGMLNHFENISIAVKNNVVTDEIMFDVLNGTVIAYFRWANPYIQDCRKIDPGFWIELERLSKKWETELARRLTIDGATRL